MVLRCPGRRWHVLGSALAKAKESSVCNVSLVGLSASRVSDIALVLAVSYPVCVVAESSV